MNSALSIHNVSLTYPTRTGSTQALADVNLEIGEGEFVALLGPSGCGKSTLLRLAAGLLAPTSGTIRLNGAGVTGPSRDTGVAFQKPSLLPWKTVRDNILLPARTQGLDRRHASQRADRLLELVGLTAFGRAYPFELSGGMQQRVGIARMLLPDPAMLLMDEPFAALDALSRETLTFALQEIWSVQRKSVLFITHSIPEAVFLADRVLVMSQRPGRIVESIANPLARPRTVDTFDHPEFTALTQRLRRHFNASQ